MVTIDGDDVTDVTIDGDPVTEITVDGDVVWTAAGDGAIEDFEGYADTTDMRSSYGPAGEIDFMELETTASLEGAQSGRFDAANQRPTFTGPGQTDTPIDHRYSFLVNTETSTSHPGMMVDTIDLDNPLDDSYHIHVSWRDDEVNIRAWVNGSIVNSPSFSITPLTVGGTYRVEFDYTHDTGTNEAVFDIEVRDHSDETLMGSGELRVTDAHVGLGSWGWHSGRDISATDPTYVDLLESDPIP